MTSGWTLEDWRRAAVAVEKVRELSGRPRRDRHEFSGDDDFSEDVMPLTKKGSKIMGNMKREYGSREGKKVFYASRNKGTIKGVDRTRKAGRGR